MISIYNMILVVLVTLGSQQANPVLNTAKSVSVVLSYMATHPDATMWYHTNGMTLHVHSDASYLSESQVCSWTRRLFFLSSYPVKPYEPPVAHFLPPPLNVVLHIISTIMKNILASNVETEIGALFFNTHKATTIHTTLSELGYSRPLSPLQIDSICTACI